MRRQPYLALLARHEPRPKADLHSGPCCKPIKFLFDSKNAIERMFRFIPSNGQFCNRSLWRSDSLFDLAAPALLFRSSDSN
jgi:hypothetical protein